MEELNHILVYNVFMIIEIPKVKCKRCNYEWTPRKADIRLCPKCKSAYWDQDRPNRSYRSKFWES